MPREKRTILGLYVPTGMIGRKKYIHMIKRLRIFAVIGLAASLGVFLLVALFGGFSNVVHTIESANMFYYFLAFVCVFLGYLARYGKWGYYMHMLGIKVKQTKSFLIYMSVYSMDITPGRIGRIIAAYTLKKITKIKFMSIVPIVTMDLFTDFFGFAILAFFTAILVGKYLIYVLAFDIILVIPFIIIINPWVFNYIKSLKKKGYLLKKLEKHGSNYYMSQNKLNKPAIYIGSLAFTVPADILNSLGLYFSLLAVGVKPKVIISLFIFATSQIFGMVSSVPGGIGVADATLIAFLKTMLGLSSTVSSAVTIMTRVATLWFGVVLGFAALAYTLNYWYSKHSKRKIRKRQNKN